MCGITGYFNYHGKPVLESNTIINMLKVQKHRGPDDSGIRAFSLKTGTSLELPANASITIDGDFEGILGFNRLSILDLSANGHQPMASPDQKVLLMMNGEIYNAFEYKKELTDWGYSFKSTTDTEIVLALYLKYGFEKMLKCLNGMFAIVIADLRERKLFIARDRFGIKPIYYIDNSDMLAFSSELKSFRCLPDFSFKLDETQIDEYMLFRSNLHKTLFNDIKSLEPGHFLTYKHEDGLKVSRYFNLNEYNRTPENQCNFEITEKKLGFYLEQSVKSQLMSDVNLGCQLSGGVDSTLITYLANSNSHKGKLESVSIVFNDSRFSEDKYIDKVAEELDIASNKFLLNADYYLHHIEKATWHFEAPINHPNTIAIYLLSQQAKEYVTVLLSGEGADEVFGGYRRFYDVVSPYWNKNILSKIKTNFKSPENLYRYFDPTNRAVMGASYMHPNTAGRLLPGFNLNRAQESRSLLYNELTGSVFDKQVKYEMQTHLPDLLLRQDKMSMAHSIENRVPFLDNDVVEFSFTIPEKYLLQSKRPEGKNIEKYILKRMVAEMFDPNFAFRKKIGFSIPIREYLMDSQFKQYVFDKLLPGIHKRGIMKYGLIKSWADNIKTISFKEIESLWIALTFEIWASVYLDLQHENWNTSN
jgi:asparagine synthase (glutamine-hydrolysing)